MQWFLDSKKLTDAELKLLFEQLKNGEVKVTAKVVNGEIHLTTKR